MAEILKEPSKIYRGVYVPEDQILEYMKAAKELNFGFKIVKKPGEYVDEVSSYEQLKNEYFIGLSYYQGSNYTDFLEKVSQLLTHTHSE